MTHTLSPVFLGILLCGAVASAYEQTLTQERINEAIALGRSRSDVARNQFHQTYRIHVGRPPVDYIDVVTPFRRLEIAVEERVRLGGHMFTQREAFATLADYRNRVEFHVEMTFHPLNTYLTVPLYTATLVRPGTPGRIEPLDMQRAPRYGARIHGIPAPGRLPAAPQAPAGSQPLLGATVMIRVDGERLDPQGVYEVLIEEAGKELARGRVDLRLLK